MMINNLIKDIAASHPYKNKFRAMKIPQVLIAKYLGIHHQSLFRMLNGYQPMPENIEHKLNQLLHDTQEIKSI